jgi:hypothetical protein
MFVKRTNSVLAQLLTLKVVYTKAHLWPMLQLLGEQGNMSHGEEQSY